MLSDNRDEYLSAKIGAKRFIVIEGKFSWVNIIKTMPINC